MSIYKKIFVLVATIILLLGLLGYKYYSVKYLNYDKTYHETWKNIGDKSLRYQIYSAYFDDRVDSLDKTTNVHNQSVLATIRVISILPIHINASFVYCHFRYKNGTIEKHKAFKVDLSLRKHKNTFYVSSTVMCAIVAAKGNEFIEYPTEIGLTVDNRSKLLQSLIKIRYPKNLNKYWSPAKELLVCASPLHNNYSDVQQIVEYFEMYKLLGATKFYIYSDTMSSNVKKVVNYYKEQKLVDEMNWKLERSYINEYDIRTDGLYASITDCLYRALVVDNYNYVAIVDFNEFLMQKVTSNGSLLDLIKRYDEKSIRSFVFKSVHFPKSFGEIHSTMMNAGYNKFLMSQMRTKRTKDYYHNRLIIKPQKVLDVGDNYIEKAVTGTIDYLVNENDGLLFNYQEKCGTQVCNASFVEDLTARKFGVKLSQNVDKICKTLGV